MKLKISKLLLESALIFQARNDVRYYLNGICFMTDGRIASTDGHRAFIGGRNNNKLAENVIIKISKSPTKRYEYATIDTKAKIATYHDEAGAMVGAGICEEIDGRFPDIDRVIPKETRAAEEIGFNAGYLVDVEKVAKLFNPKFCCVKFELNGNTDAAVCCLSAPSGETARLLLCRCVYSNKNPHYAGFVYSAFFFFVVFCCWVATSKDFSSSGMMRSFGSRCSDGSIITSPSCNSRILPFSLTKIPRAMTSYLAIIHLKFTKGLSPLFN